MIEKPFFVSDNHENGSAENETTRSKGQEGIISATEDLMDFVKEADGSSSKESETDSGEDRESSAYAQSKSHFKIPGSKVTGTRDPSRLSRRSRNPRAQSNAREFIEPRSGEESAFEDGDAPKSIDKSRTKSSHYKSHATSR